MSTGTSRRQGGRACDGAGGKWAGKFDIPLYAIHKYQGRLEQYAD